MAPRPAMTGAMTGRLSVQVIEKSAQLGALGAECDRLALAMRPRLPFASGEWLRLWWQHFQEDRWLVRDRLFVHVLRDQHGALIGVAPLVLTERPSAGRLHLRTVAFLGNDKNITELRGLICAPEHEALVARALHEHLMLSCDDWDWFTWDGVRQGGEAHQLLSALSNFSWHAETTDHVLALRDTWAEFRTTRSRNIKEALRKCYNSLARDQHVFDFRVVSEAAALPAAVESFLLLHTRRAKATQLADHADYFTGASARELLRGLASKPDQLPALRVFELRVGAELVASRLGFLLDDELYLYFSGFDPAWARYSVMTTTVAETIKWAIERKLRVVNLSAGTDVSKSRWGTSVVTTCSGVLLSPNAGARHKWKFAQGLSRRSRELSSLSHVLDHLRRRG
jgi:CelD/BcsL family acetyltransferase involved in cellulose biosynthesis